MIKCLGQGHNELNFVCDTFPVNDANAYPKFYVTKVMSKTIIVQGFTVIEVKRQS